LEKLYDEYMSGFRMTNKNSSKYRSVIFEQGFRDKIKFKIEKK